MKLLSFSIFKSSLCISLIVMLPLIIMFPSFIIRQLYISLLYWHFFPVIGIFLSLIRRFLISCQSSCLLIDKTNSIIHAYRYSTHKPHTVRPVDRSLGWLVAQ